MSDLMVKSNDIFVSCCALLVACGDSGVGNNRANEANESRVKASVFIGDGKSPSTNIVRPCMRLR